MDEGRRGRSVTSADLIRAIGERDLRRGRKRGRAQEGMWSLMFGTLSMGIGTFVMIVALCGLLDRPIRGWTEPYPVMMSGNEVEYTQSLWTNTRVARPVKDVVRMIEVPSDACVAMVLIGIGLGAAGIALEWNRDRRRGAMLSIAGAVLCALAMGLPLLAGQLLSLAG